MQKAMEAGENTNIKNTEILDRCRVRAKKSSDAGQEQAKPHRRSPAGMGTGWRSDAVLVPRWPNRLESDTENAGQVGRRRARRERRAWRMAVMPRATLARTLPKPLFLQRHLRCRHRRHL